MAVSRRPALSRSKTRVKLISVTFSLENPYLWISQTRTFEEAVGKYPNAMGYSVSMDLPFTLARYSKRNTPIHILKIADRLSERFIRFYYGS